MLIETERLIITDLTLDMCDAIQKNSVDEDNKRFVPDEVFETVEEARGAIEWLINSYECEDGPFLYPILLKDKTNIGYVQACSIEEGWELGYHIAKEYTGHGYATEAVRSFIPVIMQQLKINTLYGVVLEENVASHKVLEKCDFKLDFKGIGQYQGVDRALRRYIYKL
ncbi:GNAT family N-acetyltransferase [Anaerosporobacter faecicola]|uniref:GNAT family N-acetyltransferase n=1 Tax=Anaerosporobacter faecicola TaxID=2718714 RepID=UPI00143A5978|nr:GNAT family N-acetyltransferase [Anaerosporobacter faecicola]